jgi:Tol biopolymer transport system component
MPSGGPFSVSTTMRRVALAVATAALALGWAESARAQDPEAPDGAPKHWLANEDWINYLWLPYEESRLYKLIGQTRGDVFRWVRDEHTIAELAKIRGWEPRALAEALVAPRRGQVSAAKLRELADRAERTLTQGHLGQHILFHALHQTAVPERAERIFGTRDRQEFLQLRRAELSPLQICELNGRTRVEAQRGVSDALREAAAQGVRDGSLPPDQAQVMLDRQLRQVPRWLGQNRYNGPSGGANKPDLPEADVAKHPSISADGRTVVWDAYRADISAAERLGEIHVRAAVLGQRRFSVTPPSRTSTRRPRSAYNSVISADGNAVAFETAESTYPLAKRVGNMTVLVRDLATGKVERVSHAHRPKGAPTRTAFNPALSADGRIVAFEATDAGRDGAPSRNGLWVVDRRAGRERLVTDASRGAAYLPEVAGDGRSVAYTSAKFDNHGLTHVYLTSLKTGRTALVSRADGRDGAPAAGDAYEPSVSVDGRFVAFTSRAGNLGGDGHAEIYVRDLRRGTTRLVTGAITADAGSPSLSADGRYVAFVVRVGRPNGKRESLRSRVWRHDLQTGQDVLVSRATGARGVSADGYATDPSISVDGRLVAFASTAGNLAEAKPDGLAGVFVRDLGAGTTTLLSTHARRPGTGGVGVMAVAAPTGSVLALAFGGLLLVRRRRSS